MEYAKGCSLTMQTTINLNLTIFLIGRTKMMKHFQLLQNHSTMCYKQPGVRGRCNRVQISFSVPLLQSSREPQYGSKILLLSVWFCCHLLVFQINAAQILLAHSRISEDLNVIATKQLLFLGLVHTEY